MINTSIISKQDTYSGIYAIVNLKNNKFYIGSSKNLYKRTQHEHKRSLDLNKHPNVYLQRAYNKDSKYFIFIVLEKVNIDNLLEREQSWIDELNACEDGYNLSPTANSTTGFKMPKEAIKSGLEKRQKAVVQLSLNGEFIAIHKNIKEAQESLGNKGKHISQCCKGTRISCNGFMWVYLTDYESEEFNIKNLSRKPKKRNRYTGSKKVIQYDIQGNLIKYWNSGSEAADALSLNYKGISGCASGGRKTYAKFIWKYAD
jgi:group I intron endonuclease